MSKQPRESLALARIVQPETVPAQLEAAVPAQLETAFLAFLQSKPAAVLPIDRRVFLTMAESTEFSGLPAAFLRRLMTSGKLKALRTGAGWRISRIELEGLSGTLTGTPVGLSEEAGLSEHELRDMELNRRRRQGIAPSPAGA